MKLRNKKTGEIIEKYPGSFVISSGEQIRQYNSLAELNAEWEDYKEPKEYWYYDTTKNGVDKITHLEDKEKDQTIGNYFETKEEADKAVEKLKAWKRLKDKGFRFDKWTNVTGDGCSRPIWFYFMKDTKVEDVKSDLDLLFGGEE